jgi:hypothetical protein
MIGRNVPWYIKLSLSFILVFGTWNPLGYDIVHNLVGMDLTQLLSWFFILLLVVLWGFAVKALHEALGTFGIVIFLVLAGLLLGGLYQIGWIDINNADTMGWFLNVIMTMMLFFGLMFPVWWRQLTGKVAVEEDFD